MFHSFEKIKTYLFIMCFTFIFPLSTSIAIHVVCKNKFGSTSIPLSFCDNKVYRIILYYDYVCLVCR